ncbi:LysR family transcriptional regulator [Chelatococcus reniformis]|uniref:LysR family transcriptional regulator n=1 Tax=Chelatococcus reniformis TaxID=1494448 RepID=A0A916TZM0_9HYPH|nr:LysR family transcriptional regulator [Chelatococcus reniformis]GGC53725.1 LysR family transcriptional regulator [Chelatococcus reniformis]
MDRLDAMAVLLAVVEAGSLSAASRRMRMPLATVSRKVSELEAHLGTRLLARSSRSLALTDAGRSYAAAAKQILEQVQEAERAAAGEYSAPRGDLTVTAPVVFGRLHVLPVAIAFLKAYPEIALQLMLSDGLVDLTEDRIDVAVRIGALPDSGLIAARVGLIRRVVAASPAYLAERGTPERPEDLAAHDCITYEGLASPRTWRFAGDRGDITVAVRSRLTVNAAEAAIDAAIAGIGLTRVLSYQVATTRRAGLVTLVLEPFELAPWPVHLIHVGQGLLPVKLRAFLDFAAPRLKARLALGDSDGDGATLSPATSGP